MTRARQLADAGAKADYLDNVASDINTQLAGKLSLTGGTMTGNILFDENGTVQAEDSITFTMDSNSTNAGGETMQFKTDASTTAMTIVENGNVGIGSDASTPLGKFHVASGDSGGSVNAGVDELVVEGSGNAGMTILSGDTSNGAIWFGKTGDIGKGRIDFDQNNGAMSFATSNTERMQINTSGNVGIGTTSPSVKLTVVETGTSTVMSVQNTAAEGEVCFMVKGTDGVNNCQITGAGAATFTSHSSDERKKLILGDMPNCLAELNKLPLKRFKWRKNFDPNENEAGRDEEHWGVIAQELEKIIPELVYEDTYGSKTIDPLTMTGLCMKAVQELSAKVDALETKVTTLENA